MTRVFLAVIVASGTMAASPSQTPVYSSDTYAVAMELSVFKGRPWCSGDQPETDLSGSDFKLTVDGKSVERYLVQMNAEVPGRYFITFTVPDRLRDGKTHRIQVRLRGGAFSVESVIPRPLTEPERSGGVIQCCVDLCRRLGLAAR